MLSLSLILSGGLHHDGLMDTADGLAAGSDRCLEAMDDSRVGASGVLVLVLVVLIELAALVQLGSQAAVALCLAGLWSRVAPLWAMARFPYLRSDGTAAFHRKHARPGWDALPALLAVLLLALLIPPQQLLVGAPVGWVVSEHLGRRLGGHTGDSYGAVLVWTEAITLLLLAGLAAAS